MNTTTLKTKTCLLTLLFIAAFCPLTAQAQIPVTDAGNLAQNFQIFLKDAAMLEIMIQNIAKAQGATESVLPLLQQLEKVIQEGEALGYGSPDIAGTYRQKFPGYTPVATPWSIRSQMWTETQLNTLRNILQAVHLQNQNFSDEQNLVEEILNGSNIAIGQMQAMQQGNALAAATIKQLVKLRQLMMSQINADTVSRSAEIARHAEAEAAVMSWINARPPVVKPMQPDDPRGIGDLNFINPKH